ncbi:hypothetical protein [Kaistia terrae]|uniref:Uncharacterized protein n=1 Tax=Kaistia terrae TaxID=537017 RepID=A0ABW0PRQ5_9HYPH|nr:hypothetical protein [Kaistia terrae]MCX5578560.1 hypothetical protein [Kaistia terrae]
MSLSESIVPANEDGIILKWIWDYPIVKLGIHEFYQVPRRNYRESMWLRGPEDDVDGYVLMPIRPKDDKLDFPGNPTLESVGSTMRSGVAVYSHRDVFGAVQNGVAATDLAVFNPIDLYFECAFVMGAHGWAEPGGELSDELLSRVIEVEGIDFVAKAKKRFGEAGWYAYAGEVAARHFAAPLSRLWYVANLMSLCVAHKDDLRLGYLWAEYRIKMSYEVFALRHIEVKEKNRASGLKGGQADKKRERYHVLDRLARQHVKELAFASDRDALRIARRLTVEHDAKADAPLFSVNGKALSRDWLDEWLRHFRQAARGVE